MNASLLKMYFTKYKNTLLTTYSVYTHEVKIFKPTFWEQIQANVNRTAMEIKYWCNTVREIISHKCFLSIRESICASISNPALCIPRMILVRNGFSFRDMITCIRTGNDVTVFCTYAKPWWNSDYPAWPKVQSPWLQLRKSTGQKKHAWTNNVAWVFISFWTRLAWAWS